MSSLVHETVDVWVRVSVDTGVAEVIRDLMTITGVYTHGSCQGTIGEGGPHPFPAHVEVSWENDEALAQLQARYVVEIEGIHWGHVLPHGGSMRLDSESESARENTKHG